MINPFFDWGNDRPPDASTPSVIYEAHVKGLTSCTPTFPSGCAAPIVRSK